MKRPRAPKGTMGKLFKQAQKMQDLMALAQEELASMEVEASAGGGAIEVVISGKMELKSVKIDPEVVDPEDVETLEDLVIVVVNKAIKEVQTKSDERMAKVTGGLPGMPGMPSMPI